MFKHTLTIGLNDKETETQLIGTTAAKGIITDILLNKHGVYAFTMIECQGLYKMDETGNIIKENSIRVEIVEDHFTTNYRQIIQDIKTALNQESIMFETEKRADVRFL